MDISPFWAVFLPVLGAVLIACCKEDWERPRQALAVSTSVLTCALVARAWPVVLQGGEYRFTIIQISPGLSVTFAAEPLGLLFAMLASMLWIFATFYALSYMTQEHHRRRFFTCYTLALSATMGVAFSANLFTLYIFYEYLALITYPLVIHKQTAEAYAAGTKYIIYCFGSGALIFLGMFSLGGFAGTLDFTPGGLPELATTDRRVLALIFVALITGFGVKAALMPLHSWLPAAMVAPTPVSALLHAVAIVKAGVFGILRVSYYLYGPESLQSLGLAGILAAAAAGTIIMASVLAIRQDKLKARLAYSTIGQLSYIILGAALLSPYGLTGGLAHLVNHALLKIVLFFCAGVIAHETGATHISQLGGIGRRLPYTCFFFTLASLGLIGVLPLAGYISKLYLLAGSLQADKPLLGLVLLGSAVLSAVYYLPIIIAAYFQEGTYVRTPGLESSPGLFFPTAVLTVFCFVFGLFAHQTTLPLINRIIMAVF
ncbi:MAG: monovalent cation/H+ antiporter subunit D family protein [Dethiobacter sp.]|nr:monovalent cation/H+ antiporter subunit D family protein [Dethiobacter sp.]